VLEYEQEVNSTLGIIDTISEAFRRVAKRPWLALIPFALDLLLWFGPKLSIAQAISKTMILFRQNADALASAGGSNAEMSQAFEMTLDAVQEAIGHTNLLAAGVWGRLGVPSIATLRPIDPSVDRVIEITSYSQMLPLQLLIMVIGLLIACVFLALLARDVRGDESSLAVLARRALGYWWNMILIIVPLGIALILVLSISFLLGPLALAVGIGLFVLMILLTFLPQAVVLSEAKPWAALKGSVYLVRSALWPTLLLLALTNLLSTGFGLIWQRLLLGSTPGAIVAMLANAFVGTGLTLTYFLFYRDRLAILQTSVQEQRSESR